MEYPGFSIFGQTERQSGANRKKTDPDPIKKVSYSGTGPILDHRKKTSKPKDRGI